MRHCTACGNTVTKVIPAGDNRLRVVCTACAAVHYENPKLVVGTVPVFAGRILLCRRAIEPRRGFWTLPAGFMELGETLAEAALRETREEALAEVGLGALFSVVDVVDAGQVHVFFAATLAVPEFGAGEETLETRLFPPAEIPWAELAFASNRIALEQHLACSQSGNWQVQLAAAPRTRPG